MKKLFSIFGMVLVSLAMHATLVTQEINLSEISSQGSATWESPTITADAWQGVQKWFGDAEDAFDASEFEALVLELEEVSSVGVNYVINYADGTPNNDLTIPAGETRAQLVLKSNKIQKIVIQLIVSGSAKISKLYFQGVAGKVKEEAVVFDQYNNDGALGFWNNSLQAWSGRFSSLGLQVDDKLVIKYTLSGSEDQFRIFACAESDNVFDFASSNGSCVDPEAGTTSIAFSLNSADLALLTSKGLKIDGKNMTITGISVLKHALIWHSEEGVATGDWANDVALNDFSNFKDGNKLCIRLSALTVGDWAQVVLQKDYDAFVPELNYVFQDGDAASNEKPFIVEFPISNTMLHQLQGKYLRVRGKNFTMTDIYVKEGTPTNTVAAYLPVTSAGMATFIVPFNVQHLPDGVQAYELTNNGDATIWATEVNALEADKPVLIVAAQNEDPGYEFVSEEGASDDISSKTGTYTNGALVGTYYAIAEVPVSDGSVNNYILSNGSDGVAFYQVKDNTCSVAPYRAYLSCGYNASAAGPNPAPMRIVFHKDAPTGVENTESAKFGGSAKFLRDGQLIILRNGVEYNANGALIK